MPDAAEPQQYVSRLLAQLRQDRVVFFPIRHHSPACARHVSRWIEMFRPSVVLIEGPESLTPFVPFLEDLACVMPVACYTNFVDLQGRLAATTEGSALATESTEPTKPALTQRFAAYYPLCDYSPELVALRAGRQVGAKVRFVDLEFAEKVLHTASQHEAELPVGVQIDSLTADSHLAYSTYTRELAQRLGCRDFNELWDHLFESHGVALSTDDFMDRVAAFCAMSRLIADPVTLVQDGTHAREACMAAAIREELAMNINRGEQRPVFVVTGGFHTVALPDLVLQEIQRPTRPAFKSGEVGTWLIRYSFDRLDALSGYASGMPSPAFYDRIWQAGAVVSQSLDVRDSTPESQLTACVAELLVDIGRLVRERKLPTTVSTSDVLAAVHMAEQLARLRGHAWPQREDVLDAIRACLVKGEMQSAGELLMSLVRKLLAGDRIGSVPAGVGVPPIVEDFRRLCRTYRISTETIEPRELTLDLYREARHRELSRLLHRLHSLGAPFARLLAGPDFIHGTDLERMTEEWRLQWTPATESGLIDAAVYGSSIEEAAIHKLLEQTAELEQTGASRSTAVAVNLLVMACRMGLHDHVELLLQLIERCIAADSELPSLTTGLAQLSLLRASREPLEAMTWSAVPLLIERCFQRACQLTRDTFHCPDQAIDGTLRAFSVMREVLASQGSAAQS